MGRIMSFGQDGQLVRDFDKSEYDFLRRYGRTPDEVMAENVKLREVISDAEESARLILDESRALEAENAKLQASNEVIAEDHAALCEQNAKLRELVADMYEGLNCPTESYEGCPPCPFNSDNGCAFELRMRELGVMCE